MPCACPPCFGLHDPNSRARALSAGPRWLRTRSSTAHWITCRSDCAAESSAEGKYDNYEFIPRHHRATTLNQAAGPPPRGPAVHHRSAPVDGPHCGGGATDEAYGKGYVDLATSATSVPGS